MKLDEKTWKLFFPILLVVTIMMLSYYSRDLLKYGNRAVYPIEDIVGVLMFIIIGLGVVVILLIIDVYLSNYLQEIRIRELEEDLKYIKKGEKK